MGRGVEVVERGRGREEGTHSDILHKILHVMFIKR